MPSLGLDEMTVTEVFHIRPLFFYSSGAHFKFKILLFPIKGKEDVKVLLFPFQMKWVHVLLIKEYSRSICHFPLK